MHFSHVFNRKLSLFCDLYRTFKRFWEILAYNNFANAYTNLFKTSHPSWESERTLNGLAYLPFLKSPSHPQRLLSQRQAGDFFNWKTSTARFASTLEISVVKCGRLDRWFSWVAFSPGGISSQVFSSVPKKKIAEFLAVCCIGKALIWHITIFQSYEFGVMSSYDMNTSLLKQETEEQL